MRATACMVTCAPPKLNRGLRRRARDHARRRSHQTSSVVVGRVLRVIMRYSDRRKQLQYVVLRSIWFPDRTQILILHQIEFNSIRFVEDESLRFNNAPR